MTDPTITTDTRLAAAIRAAIDGKTKPLGALGHIEALAAQIAAFQGTIAPRAESCTLTIFAGDHGIAEDGVSAYPQAVTRQMVLNFLAGGAASNVFAATLGIPVMVVDAGVANAPLAHPNLISRRAGPGTANFRHQPAMTGAEAGFALSAGREIGFSGEADAAIFGEMGIANTASAAMLAHKITGLDLAPLVGRGTGLDDAGLAAKRSLLSEAARRTPETLDPLDALTEYGGFEIAMMAGAMIGAAAAGRIVLVDGFIATAAALVATRLEPGTAPALVHAHVSAEAGHRPLLDALGATPLLALDLRLGEGTGALLAWPLVRAAAAMMRDMASFSEAGVSGPA